MANLFERLSGIGLTDEGTGKIGIHAFCGALNEFRRGKMTGAQVVAMFSLDATQTTQATALKDLLVAAPQRTEFMRVLKDCLYMAESETDSPYLTQGDLVARLQEEVTDQGGTLP